MPYNDIDLVKLDFDPDKIDTEKPEMKKIEADLQALIQNKAFTGELNRT